MKEENTILAFRLNKIDETRHSFLEQIKHNELKSKEHKKLCKTLN